MGCSLCQPPVPEHLQLNPHISCCVFLVPSARIYIKSLSNTGTQYNLIVQVMGLAMDLKARLGAEVMETREGTP